MTDFKARARELAEITQDNLYQGQSAIAAALKAERVAGLRRALDIAEAKKSRWNTDEGEYGDGSYDLAADFCRILAAEIAALGADTPANRGETK